MSNNRVISCEIIQRMTDDERIEQACFDQSVLVHEYHGRKWVSVGWLCNDPHCRYPRAHFLSAEDFGYFYLSTLENPRVYSMDEIHQALDGGDK